MDEKLAQEAQAPKGMGKEQMPKSETAKPVRRKTTKLATTQEQPAKIEMQTGDILLFDKYSYNVEVLDPSLRNYINLKPIAYPNSYGRGAQKDFSKANINIIERLENALMRGGTGGKISGHVIRTKGRLQGKKLKVMKVIELAFAIVNKQTNKNPIEVFIRALENSAPIEDTTRVIYGGITSNVAVDISASRRLDIALRNIALAAVIGAFSSKRGLHEALANELMLASSADINSYAIKRKNEVERMARSAK